MHTLNIYSLINNYHIFTFLSFGQKKKKEKRNYHFRNMTSSIRTGMAIEKRIRKLH